MKRLVLLIVAWLIAVSLTLTACGGTSKPASVTHPAPPHTRTVGFAPHTAGAPVVGEVLTTTNGTWTNSPTSFAYQWQRCSPSCANITGATASSYTVQTADVGDTIDVIVTATNAGGSASQTSAPTGVVTSGNGPTNTTAPAVTGVTDISSFVAPQLVATTGSWTGSPTSYTLQWQDCNSSGTGCIGGQGAAYGPGASGSSCTITTALNGCSYNLTANEYNACPAGGAACTIKLAVTATNTGGSTTSTVSAGTVTNSNPSSPYPNYSNTGYQNTPANFNGYGNQSYAAQTGGTEGVPNPALLTVASSSSPTCPTTFQSNHTYSGCLYKLPCTDGGTCLYGLTIGSSGSHISNVHFVGDLFEAAANGGPGPKCGGTYCDNTLISTYCSSGCTFDYSTFQPDDLSVPDLAMPQNTTAKDRYGVPEGHGTTYAKGYGDLCSCGWLGGTTATGFTFDHDDMWGGGGYIIVGPNTSATPSLIQDNWMHDQAACSEDTSCTQHPDGIGMVNTGSSSGYITINHNNEPYANNDNNNIAFQSGTYTHLTITNNVFSGEGYMIAVWATSTATTFTGNRWTNANQSLYGPLYQQSFWTQSGSTWAHNKFAWDPTGTIPFYETGPGNGDTNQVTAASNGLCWVPGTPYTQVLSATDYGGGAC